MEHNSTTAFSTAFYDNGYYDNRDYRGSLYALYVTSSLHVLHIACV